MAITIATLRAAGISDEQIVRIAEAADEHVRKLNAARQARFRQRKRNESNVSNVSNVGNVTLTDRESTSSESQSKKRKKVSLPDFWLPNENGLALAKHEGWDDHKIKLEIHRFQDHAQQHNRQYADWQAAWRNWVTSPYQNGAKNGHAKKPTLVELGEQLADEARAIERRAGIGRQDDPFGID